MHPQRPWGKSTPVKFWPKVILADVSGGVRGAGWGRSALIENRFNRRKRGGVSEEEAWGRRKPLGGCL